MMIIFVLVFVLILRARALEMKVIEIGFKSDSFMFAEICHSFLCKQTCFHVNKNKP